MVVTFADMYRQQQELIDEVRTNTALTRDKLTPGYVDHEARLRALERWRWSLAGISGLAAVIASVVIHIIR